MDIIVTTKHGTFEFRMTAHETLDDLINKLMRRGISRSSSPRHYLREGQGFSEAQRYMSLHALGFSEGQTTIKVLYEEASHLNSNTTMSSSSEPVNTIRSLDEDEHNDRAECLVVTTGNIPDYKQHIKALAETTIVQIPAPAYDRIKLITELKSRNPSIERITAMLDNVTELDIRVNTRIHNIDEERIGAQGMHILAHVLKTNKSVTSLNLSYHQIMADGAKALVELLKTNKSLTSLGLWGNKIGDDGAKLLAESLKTHESITAVDLTSNGIGSSGAKALAEMLKINKSMISLHFKLNTTRPYMEMLSNALFGLLKFDIEYNEPRKRAIKELIRRNRDFQRVFQQECFDKYKARLLPWLQTIIPLPNVLIKIISAYAINDDARSTYNFRVQSMEMLAPDEFAAAINSSKSTNKQLNVKQPAPMSNASFSMAMFAKPKAEHQSTQEPGPRKTPCDNVLSRCVIL